MRAVLLLASLAGFSLCAQDVVMIKERVAAAPAGAPKTMVFFRGPGNDVVKGAPYSAESVTEHVQLLADGNRISQSNKSTIYRDSEGRTRRETSISGLGPVGQTDSPVQSVVIDDPVAKVLYTLEPSRKLAIKQNSGGGMNIRINAMPTGATWQEKNVVFDRRVAAPEGKVMENVSVHVTTKLDSDAKKVDLGTRNIEGVSAKGTRIVHSIPAGQVGNERPIEVVTESWYSDEIQATVLTKHSDPRSGEMTTKLLNIRLGEPSKSLFEPPSDYKIEEMKGLHTPGGAATFHVKEDR